MLKLEIENFQSIQQKTEIEFVEGVNLIIGPSNSGKTAILRALRGLILNYRGKVGKYLSHFQDEISVSVEPGNDTKYTWLKSEKGTKYETLDLVTNQLEEYKKCGNDNIFTIAPEFPFILRDKKLLNTHTEHDGLPFPFDMNDIELFKVFEDLYKISSSSSIFKFMKKLESQNNSLITQKEELIVINKTKIENIINLENKYDLSQMDKLKEKAQNVINNFEDLSRDCEIARNNNRISKSIKKVLDNKKSFDLSFIEQLKDLKEDYRIVNNNDKISNLKLYIGSFNTAVIEEYRALSSDLITINKLERDIEELNDQEEATIKEIEEIKSQLAEVDVCPLCGNKIKEKING